MSSTNFYDILGLGPNATKDEIKKAYRSLSLKYHPDKNGTVDAVSKFQEINEAYEVLGDEQKKADYDNTRNNPFFGMGGFPGSGGHTVEVNMNDIFSSIFGGGGGHGIHFGGMGMPPGMHGIPGMPGVHIFRGGFPPNVNMNQKPTPIIKTLAITMEQVLHGATIPLEIERWLVENGNKVFEKENIYVDIPKGVDDNEIIIIRDKGNILSDEVKGDIKIFVKVENTSCFERRGLDLMFEKKISLKESLCGFTFEIKHINGKTYTINNHSGNIIPPNYNKTIPNMGLIRDNHVGNMIIHFNVEFPTSLTPEQIKHLNDVL
jgi:DnaJ-class molecular chaperone